MPKNSTTPGKAGTNVTNIKQPARRKRAISVPRGEKFEDLYIARIAETTLPPDLHIIKGDYVVVSICQDMPDGTLACVKRASDGLVTIGFFYREPDGAIRLEDRPPASAAFTISEQEVESIARVIRIERDIPPPQEGGRG